MCHANISTSVFVVQLFVFLLTKELLFFGWLPNRMLFIPFLLLLERGLIFHLFIHTIAVRSSSSYILAEILECPVFLGNHSLLQVHVYIWDKWVRLETVIMNNISQFQILTTTHLEFVCFLAILFQFLAGNHWQEKSLASINFERCWLWKTYIYQTPFTHY